MKESSTYQAILREGRAEGIAQGLAEGRIVGREEGRADEACALILRLGTKRFGEPEISTITTLSTLSLEHLEDLALRPLEVESWAELLG